MTELEREILMRLLIDLFLERPEIERREREEQESMNARAETGTPHNRSLEYFSENSSIFPLSPYAD